MKIIITLLLFASFLAPYSYCAENHTGEKTEKTYNYDNKNGHTIINNATTTESPPEAQNTGGQHNKKNESTDENWWSKLKADPVATFTALLFVATMALFIATRQLVTGAERTASQQLRAYVCVTRASMLVDPINRRLRVILRYKNTGQTPAYNLHHWIALKIASHPLTETLEYPPSDKQYPMSIVGPGSEPELTNEVINIPIERLRTLGTAESTLYAYGEIFYTDAFGQKRFTRYRLLYGGDEPMIGTKMRPDLEGNEAN